MNGASLLILAILSSSAVGMTMKAANTRRIHFGQFMAINYLVCAFSLLIFGSWRSILDHPPEIWFLGIFVGFLYVICLWLFHQAIEEGGLALSTTLMRLSAALPTIGSLLLFSERTNYYQMLGIGMAFCCLPLASKAPLRVDSTWKGMIWGLLLFAAYGLTDFTFKIQVELAPTIDPSAYMGLIFGTAMLLSVPNLVKGATPTKDCLAWGVILGTMNVLTTYFRIRTLSELPGAVAFPTLGLGVIAVTTMASMVIWKERLRQANYVFLGLASVAVLLINLR